jgi:PknH-like extracellular domain
MRKVTARSAAAAIGISVVACGGDNQSSPASSTSTATQLPVAQTALTGLLLTLAETDHLLGFTGMTAGVWSDTLVDSTDLSQMTGGCQFPKDCFPAYLPAMDSVYASSGETAVHLEKDPYVIQAVVLFPSAKEALAFFAVSTTLAGPRQPPSGPSRRPGKSHHRLQSRSSLQEIPNPSVVSGRSS